MKVTTTSLLALLESQSYRCAFSGRDLTPEQCSLDHKIPISRGGLHVIDNCALVTPEINSAKGSMTADEFIAMCRDVVRIHGTGIE